MLTLLYRVVAWLVQKLGVAMLILVLGLGAYACWLFARDHIDFDLHRLELLQQFTGEQKHLQAALGDVKQRLAGLETELVAQQERLRMADRVIAALRADDTWWSTVWDKLFGDAGEVRTKEERLARLAKLQADTTARIAGLRNAIIRTTWERDGLEIALGRANKNLAELERNQSKVLHYLNQAWRKTRWYVIGALAVWFLGPTLWSLLLYYGVAPRLSRGRAIQLAEAAPVLPEVGESHVSAEVSLWPGESVWVREKFLQASDEGLRRRTRFVLDWRIPFTCAACGLSELVELGNEQAAAESRVTFSNQADPHVELAILALPEGASIVLRPSFLAGVVKPRARRLVIRRHWRLFTWQSWITLQFRYFEFCGPCRLIVAGSRGVRAEVLADRVGQTAPARRTNQDATIGFTPNLRYRPVRAETFWAYYRGMNPLFDDLFEGPGLFLCQEVSKKGETSRARQFWAGVRSGVLKVFGL
ncbi:MAG: hypothetical protein PHE83_07970 [Opitutaceae bacterium]|nr:hypothetical protein [Opitutaceae bacterium]